MAYQPKSYKKFVATAATATLVASAIAPVASAATFTDVNSNYTEAVNYLVANKIAQGTTETTFGTTASITRGDAAVMIANALGLDTSKAPESAFTDLNNRVKASVNALSAAGIINGKSTTQFAPDDNITRAEMAKVIALAYKLDKSGTTNEFTDVNSTFDEYVDALVKYEITLGKTESLFGATQNVTRGEFALFVFRAENLSPATPEVVSVSAINSTEAVVEFNTEIGDVTASNFTVDNNTSVIKAVVNPDNKKQVTLTFNKALVDLTTYTVTVDDVKSVKGGEMEEAATIEFKYEIAEVASVQLTSTKFYDGDNVLEDVVVKDSNGLVLDNADLTLTISSTDVAVDAAGDVNTADKKSFYVEVKVMDGSDELATTGAVKIEVAPELEITGLDGIHIGDLGAGTEEADYEAAKRTDDVVTGLKVNENGATLNLFAKDVDGNVVLVTPDANTVVTNNTPTVANITVVAGEFVVNTVSTGKATSKIKADGVEYTVSFDVLANEKIADATLSSSSVKLDSSTNNLVTTKDVQVTLKDQYNEDFAFTANTNALNDTASVVTYDNGSKLTVKSSNVRVATASVTDAGVVTIARPANHLKGSATVTVEFKDASGKVVFTKSIAVTSTDFDSAVASYDLVSVSTNTLLDADNDLNETGADVDDSVAYVLNQLDKYGNVIGQEAFAGAVTLTATTSVSADQKYIDAVAYAGNTATVAFTADADTQLTSTGTVKISATVNGVTVDTLNVAYKNTDSVADKANVNTTSRLVDLSTLGGTTVELEELIFGKTNAAATKYLLNPALTIADQFGKVMAYDIATATDTLANGVVVDASTAVVTNLNNVSNTGGTLALVDDTKSGSFTIVLPTVTTTENGDLLSAPVSFNVTLVK